MTTNKCLHSLNGNLSQIITEGESTVCVTMSNKPVLEGSEYVGTSFFLPSGYNFSVINIEAVGASGNFINEVTLVRGGNYIYVSTTNVNLQSYTLRMKIRIYRKQ